MGCYHRVHVLQHPIAKRSVSLMEWDMESFLKETVVLYLKLAGSKWKIRAAWTPFLDGNEDVGPRAPHSDGQWSECPCCHAQRPPGEFRRDGCSFGAYPSPGLQEVAG